MTRHSPRLVLAGAITIVTMMGGALWGQETASEKAAAAAGEGQPKLVDPNKVVIKVGEDTMTAGQFEEFVADLGPQAQEASKGPAKRMIADQIVNFKMMAAEARKRGIDKSPKFQRQMKMVEDQMLASMLASDVQGGVSEKDLQVYLDAHALDYETAKARHILVRFQGSPVPVEQGKKDLTEEEAKAKAEELRKKIVDGGTDFAAVAKVDSDDKGSGAQGGDLGTFTRDQMVKPFADAAFSMQPGEVSQPVKSQFGYHIIQLQEKSAPTLVRLKEEVLSKVTPLKLEDLNGKLKSDLKPEVDESYFGKARPAVAPAPPVEPKAPANEGKPAPEPAPADSKP